MATRNQNLQAVPAEMISWIRDMVNRRSLRGAARVLGVSRQTVTTVLADLPVSPGTLALLREADRLRPRDMVAE